MKISKYAIIIGGMKCGSTSLFRYIGSHEAVCPSIEKEPNFYSDDLVWGKGLEWYESLWPDWNPKIHKTALEGSVSYTKSIDRIDETVNRMSAVDAEKKLIFIIRNPIARIESHYTHAYIDGWPVTKHPLNEFIDPYLIDVSRYAAQLSKFESYMSAGDLHIVNFDDLKERRVDTLNKIFSFLEVDKVAHRLSISKVHNRSSDKTKLSKIGSLGIRIGLNEYMPKSLRDSIKPLFQEKIAQNFQLSSDQKAMVTEELKEDLFELKNKYNVDITSWELGIDSG